MYHFETSIPRRHALGVLAGGIGSLLFDPWGAGAAPPYRVAICQDTEAYRATRRAIVATGEWPAATISGRTVIIKPNLVGGQPSDSGITTDPQVVRAVVDMALEAGAAAVRIVEGGYPGAPFEACGYSIFAGYDGDGRVSLVDLSLQPLGLPQVPGGGLAYRRIYLPTLLLDPNAVFISIGKLKTHTETTASLTVKNLFGLPPVRVYFEQTELHYAPRYHLHDRGSHQVIADLARTRRIDFAVIDGMWGMEGNGPTLGQAVQRDVVVAGSNAVAVDRVGLWVMGVPQDRPQHLAYAALVGLGPANLSQIQVVGDAVTPQPFAMPSAPPTLWFPKATPNTFAPSRGDQTGIGFKIGHAADARIEILKTSEFTPVFTVVRTLRDWTPTLPGIVGVIWDGRDNEGTIVPAGLYLVRVQARWSPGDIIIAAASSGVFVTS